MMKTKEPAGWRSKEGVHLCTGLGVSRRPDMKCDRGSLWERPLSFWSSEYWVYLVSKLCQNRTVFVFCRSSLMLVVVDDRSTAWISIQVWESESRYEMWSRLWEQPTKLDRANILGLGVNQVPDTFFDLDRRFAVWSPHAYNGQPNNFETNKPTN